MSVSPTSAEVYGYGFLSISVISVVPLGGILIARWRERPFYRLLVIFLFGLGIGTLLGDFSLHLVPDILTKFDGGDGGDGGAAVQSRNLNEQMLLMLYTIWALLLFETFFKLLQARAGAVDQVGEAAGRLGHAHGHSHGHAHANGHAQANGHALVPAVRSSVASLFQVESGSAVAAASEPAAAAAAAAAASGGELAPKSNMLPWILTIADLIHNFTDGLAIAAAYSQSLGTGVSTSIAIFCHEVPHEFGDTAAMLNAGWSWRRVLVFQFIATTTAFVGFFIGAPLSQSMDAEIWILSLAAASFVYVSLADMIPEVNALLLEIGTFRAFLLTHLGFVLGSLVLVLLTFFEDAMGI